MGKSTYTIKETKDRYKFSYCGDLKEAVEKARKDLAAEEANKEIPYWTWIKEKATKAIVAHEKKKARIRAFIACAENQLKKEAQQCE